MFTSTLSPSHRLLIKAGLVVSSLMVLSPAYAATQCVSNSALLLSTLFLGQTATEPLTIRLVKGTYFMTTDLDFLMAQPTAIEGGYNADCTLQAVDAANTTIDMGNKAFTLNQREGDPIAELRVEALTVRNALKFSLDAGGYAPLTANDEGQLAVRNVRLTQIGNVGSATLPVFLKALEGPMIMENVVLDHLQSSLNCAVYMSSRVSAAVLVNHLTADFSGNQDFCIDNRYESASNSFYNSILNSSDGGRPHFISVEGSDTDSTYSFVNNMMLSPLVSGTVSVVNSLSEAPRWIDPVAGNYRLSTNPLSAGINSGSFVPPGGEPSTDIAGNPRIQGSFPDRGAYESTYNDATTLTVTNTQDSGGGSLRQAILDANSSPLIAKQITFNIRGGLNVPVCPAVIALNSALPAIAAPMSIDGYSQPVSTKNTDPDAFNANLCVSIKAAASSLPTGFKVLANAPPSVNFSLRGVGMGGFGQPVVLLGGSNHVIAGNQFGGTALGVNLPGAGLNAIAIGVNAGGSLIVGGNNVVDRNVIVDANFAGINIQSDVVSSIDRCQIVNNLIGLKPDGNSALANSTGISANGEGCGITGNRIAGNSSTQVLINGNKNVLQNNRIGITVNGQGPSNLATGVLIRGSGNIVGAGGGSSTLGANTIRFNSNGGVVVEGGITASGNSVNANAIYDNGTAGLAMDIDLQPSSGMPAVTIEGPTANDMGDLDIGPNFLQNYPVAKGLVYTGSNSTNRPATLSAMLDALPGTHRVDVYFSSSAHPYSRRGHAQQHIARATVIVDSNGRKSFTLPIEVPTQVAGGVISMTATDGVGNTSEVGNGLATDTLFADGVD